MNYRLQFTHHSEVFTSRDEALKFISDLYNTGLTGSMLALYGEPYVVQYQDQNIMSGELQTILAIGKPDAAEENQYQIMDTAFLEQQTINLSGATVGIKELLDETAAALEAEKEKSNRIQEELDRTQLGAGLNEDGTYAKQETVGDNKIYYINNANSLSNADRILDNKIYTLSQDTIQNINVNGVEGETKDRIAYVTIDTNDIKVDEEYKAKQDTTQPHPIHSGDTLTDALAEVEAHANYAIYRADKLTIDKVTENLPANVKEEYRLLDADGNKLGTPIQIYNDRSLNQVYLGHTDDRLVNGVIESGSGETALCFLYNTESAGLDLVKINVQKFLEESEFKDGLKVNNHVVSVLKDPTSENFLSISPNGVKISGVQDAIDNAKKTVQQELDKTQIGAGLNEDGEYKVDGATNYIKTANSLYDADKKLDIAIKAEVDRATSAETALQAKINTEVTDRKKADEALQTQINTEVTDRKNADKELQTQINTEVTDRKNADKELETSIKRSTVTSSDKSLIITARTEGTDAIVNVDGKTIIKDDGTLQSALKLAKKTEGNEANVKEAYYLVDAKNEKIVGETIKIYKESSLVEYKLGHVDDTLNDYGYIVDGTGEAALDFVYQLADGKYKLVMIPVTTLLEESEFKDGLKVNNHVVSVLKDPASENFLSISPNGVKISGVQDAIDNAKKTVQQELDKTQIGAGLNEDGTYVANEDVTYIAEAKSLSDADKKLDNAIFAEVKRATSAETELNDAIKAVKNANTTLSGDAKTAVEKLQESITKINNRTIKGLDAITIGGDADKVVSLKINNDKNSILSINENGLCSTLKLAYDNKYITLTGINGANLGKIDCTNFLKDGMIESATVEDIENAPNLIITFNTDSGKEKLSIPLSKLVDTYTVDNNSAQYLEITDYVLSAKVDKADGLASYNKLTAVTHAVEVLTGDTKTPGSVKHILDDAIVDYTGGTAEKSNRSLLRVYEADGNRYYYASSDVADMYYGDKTLNTVIEGLTEDDVTTNNALKGLSGQTKTIENAFNTFSGATNEEIKTINENITTLSDSKKTIENNLKVLSGSTKTIENNLGTVTETVNELVEASNNNTGNITNINSSLNNIAEELEGKETRIKELETNVAELTKTVETLTNEFDKKVYEKVISILKGTEKEIKITYNKSAETATIGFQDDAVFGPISNSKESNPTPDNPDSGDTDSDDDDFDANIFNAIQAVLYGADNEVSISYDAANETVTIGFADDALIGPTDNSGEATPTTSSVSAEFKTKVFNAVASIVKGADKEIKVTNNTANETTTIGFADDALIGPTDSSSESTSTTTTGTVDAAFKTKVYNKLVGSLKGTDKEIKVTSNSTNETITIGYADDAIFGE
jgi:hypothetical protein